MALDSIQSNGLKDLNMAISTLNDRGQLFKSSVISHVHFN